MLIEVHNKRFGATQVLRDIRLEISAAERVAILGPSGVGKSTLLRIVAGLDTDFDGTVTGAGQIAMVFQEPALLPWRSALQNLTLVTGCSIDDAERHLEAVGLAAQAIVHPGTMSLGQQRRLALARAFAAAPDTLLLDEAFASLDEATAQRMHDLTLRMLADRPVRALMVTHDLAEAVRIGDRIIALAGTPAEVVLSRPSAGVDGAGADLAAAIRSELAYLGNAANRPPRASETEP